MIKKNFLKALIITGFIVTGVTGMSYAASSGMPQAGVAAAVKGEVKATTPPDKTARVLKSGDKIFMGDRIETGADGQLQILLLDETVFTLGPSGSIKVDEFVFDPSNDEGKVKASMMKGIFRVVSGRVAHKKPENMLVDLPAGVIGFRGTNVAGIIDGQKTTVVLLGPVGVGRIFVTNIVNGEVVAVDVNEAGYATIVDGPNSAPVPVFQISEAELNRIAAALGQKVTGAGAGTTGVDSGAASSPKGPVNTQSLMDLLNTVDDMSQTSMTAAQDKAQQNSSGETKENKQNSVSHGKYP